MSLFDNDAITIIRYGPVGADRNRTKAPVYTGNCEFQTRNGQTFTDAAGNVHTVDAVCIISPDGTGALPAVLEDDVVQFNGKEYSIFEVDSRLVPPAAHVELRLKRGPLGLHEPRA